MGERIGFGLYQSCRNRGSVIHVCCGGMGVLGEWLGGLSQGIGGWGGVMYVCVVILDYLCR